MARDYLIHGEALVKVKGMVGTSIADVQELGLSDKQIKLIPRFLHKGLLVNDYGDVPAGIVTRLADAFIEMTLVNFDKDILRACWGEAQGGWFGATGTLQGAGVILDGGAARFADGWRYISLNLTYSVGTIQGGSSDGFNGMPWRFYKTYICDPPQEFPIGNDRTIVKIRWHALPYQTPSYSPGETDYGGALPDYISQNTILWDHSEDE